jgi:hypothetical protein
VGKRGAELPVRNFEGEAESGGTSEQELIAVAAGAFVLALAALAWSLRHGALVMYGDAEAHLHIARRLFDSHRPGITQLGTVWLPLPHLLLLPFVAVDSWWRSGFAGAVPSGIEYLLAAVGLYRLARRWMSVAAALFALILFAANPNFLYLSTTAMTEPLFLAELVWAVLLLAEWRAAVVDDLEKQNKKNYLMWMLTGVLIAAVFTRYDGWVLGFTAWVMMAWTLKSRGEIVRGRFVWASLLLLAAPLVWMGYNAAIFSDPLDFLRGPYSAAAIEARTSGGLIPPHPGWHNPWVAFLFYAKVSEMVAAVGAWGQVFFALAAAGSVWAWMGRQARAGVHRMDARWALLLWLPLPFYCYSVAYGSVPIFLPVWWPHSFYNTRYGLELLPALALFAGFAAESLLGALRERRPQLVWAVAAVLIAAAIANVWWVGKNDPLVFAEARGNDVARGVYEQQIAARLKMLHQMKPGAVVLMETSSYPGIVAKAGMTLSETINESDKEFYKAALNDPAAKVDVALAFSGDAVEMAMQRVPGKFEPVWKFNAMGQPAATLYVSDSFLKSGVGMGGAQ